MSGLRLAQIKRRANLNINLKSESQLWGVHGSVRARIVQRLNRSWVQLKVRRFHQFLQLLDAGGARNRGGDARPRNQPGNRHFPRRGIKLGSHFIQRGQNSEPAIVQIFLHHLPARSLGKIALRPVLARQKSASQRKIRNYADAFLQAERFEILFIGGSFVKVVVRLQALVAWQSVIPWRS